MDENEGQKYRVVLVGNPPPKLVERIHRENDGLEVVIRTKDEYTEDIIDIIHQDRIQTLVLEPLQEPPTKQDHLANSKFFGRVSNQYPKSKKRDTRFSNRKRRS